MATPLPSQVSQSYHPDCEDAINRHVHLELYASYVYTSMACYFDRVSSKHLVEFFLQQSSKEKEHAQRLIQLQNQRGGGTFARNISRPDRNCWGNSLKALECALHLSMTVNQSLIDLHKLATEKMDANLCDFLESHFLQGQEKFIKELGGYITNLRKIEAPESGLAEYLFGKLTLGNSKKN